MGPGSNVPENGHVGNVPHNYEVGMAIDVTVPAVGESVSEGRIAKWLKPDGSAVAVDEPLFELETDKASQEITAQSAGVLSIKVKEGEVVKIGAVVAAIDPNGKASSGGVIGPLLNRQCLRPFSTGTNARPARRKRKSPPPLKQIALRTTISTLRRFPQPGTERRRHKR